MRSAPSAIARGVVHLHPRPGCPEMSQLFGFVDLAVFQFSDKIEQNKHKHAKHK